VEVDGAPVALDAEDVVISEQPREGWAVASGEADTIALDLTLTPELVALGHAREVVRLVQDGRKQSGFDVSDRIELWWTADGELASSIDQHRDAIADEVLAVSFEPGPGPDGLEPAVTSDGLSVWLRVADRS
jgi:isoleucyl-tRNA synthetase